MRRLSLFFVFIMILSLFLPKICPVGLNSTTFGEDFTELNYALDEENGGGIVYNFLVYDENNNLIFERSNVELGDIIITKDFKEYEVVEIDITSKIAKAKFIGEIKKPNIKKNKNSFSANSLPNKKIGLYMTHNDESYVIGDGVSSINGAGGIHDVAKRLSLEMNKLGIKTTLDETIHNPHNSLAYSRSEKTAKKLVNSGMDATFDIHRDGVARSVYVDKVNNVERCKVRIVVGQANPNKAVNLEFATYLFAVAEEYCPWLFLDIYFAKGHYNQALSPKCLLFEMGTYLAEKDLVLNTVPYLASVIDTTLYSTTVEEDKTVENESVAEPNLPTTDNNFSSEDNLEEEITIVSPADKIIISDNLAQEDTLSNILDSKVDKKGNGVNVLWIVIGSVLILNFIVALCIGIYYFNIEKRDKKTRKKVKKI